jgi:hypothetical protein
VPPRADSRAQRGPAARHRRLLALVGNIAGDDTLSVAALLAGLSI